MEINKENFVDVAEAIHCFLTLNHEGQSSNKYRLLSQSLFKPGPMWSETEVEMNNEYYNAVTELTESEIEASMSKILLLTLL